MGAGMAARVTLSCCTPRGGGDRLRAVDLDLEVLLAYRRRGRDDERAQQAQGQADQRATFPGEHGASLRRPPIEANPVLV